MRIGYITSQLPYPPASGGTVKTLATLSVLVRGGHEVHLFCFGPVESGLPIKKIIKMGVRSVFCQSRELVLEKAMLRHGSFFWRSLLNDTPYTLEKFKHPTLRRKVDEFCRNKRPDVMWVDHFNLIPYLPSSFSGISVLEEHNIQSLLFSRLADREGNPLLRFIYRLESAKWERFERKHLPRFSMVGAISEADREYLRRRFGLLRVRLLGTAIAATKTQLRPKKQLLFIGRLTWKPNWQGLDWFLRFVWPKLRRRFPDYRLIVVGDYVKRLRRIPGVEYVGNVSDIEPYVLASTALICPIFAGSGIRIKILQAMAAGVPVVSTTLGAEGIPVEEGRSILLADTPKEFENALERLLTRKDLRDRLVRGGRKVISEHYSLSIFQKRIHEFLT
ncbi:MAG: hypothetical protein A2900_01320 [Candidatus Chisholmbacteria bacterium RIFCSPLOWO2_01_FULL_50_28]|uniref:Glycosyltransferase subfamily 4-like N-terminal domain-containing protein n=1 Tax=Candidatus Chisholmbacteria bacterium RIFCSPHIGHO2_01_FULL_52_32 TaxID=1797591 RepID=A0A1G1VU65_9BACT|nr:MAG: hypothetical protein A2786_05420 [Candidatus Chisholmbacteria bacterium RIFCSPHIGHO2_01_FULL_52_32]OGY19729.1 MAG: hypothetical protein A2900_01320 [Candidatus Chisholmbacteria bacterium RIFCSPLOWO2_01_FULL_50_28]